MLTSGVQVPMLKPPVGNNATRPLTYSLSLRKIWTIESTSDNGTPHYHFRTKKKPKDQSSMKNRSHRKRTGNQELNGVPQR